MYKKSFRRIMSLIFVMSIVGGLFGRLCSPTAYAEEGETKRDAIIVSMGDSFSSGEGIPPFYGSDIIESFNSSSVSDINKSFESFESFEEVYSAAFENMDWVAHRSPGAWSGMLTLPELEGNMANYKWAGSATHYDKEGSNGSDSGLQEKEIHWYFVASSGATTEHIFGEQEKTLCKRFMPGTEFEMSVDDADALPAQIKVFDVLKEEGKKADYVTITIGGNDAGFSDVITQTLLVPSLLNVNHLTNKINKTWEEFYKEGGIRDNLVKTYSEIAERAGEQAHIIVGGYPQLLSHSLLISEDEARIVNNTVHNFNEAIEKIVKLCKLGTKATLVESIKTGQKYIQEPINISFVSVEDAFLGHEAYTENSFFNELVIPAQADDLESNVYSSYSFHPNEKGALVYAACVQDEIDRLEGVSSESRSVYETYQNAFQLTTASGCWSEELSITADMQMTNGSQTMKGTLYMSSDLDVSGYDKDDLSNLCISGSVSIGMAGMEYAWDVDYEDGVAQYNWTEPQVQTTTASIQPSFFEYQQLTENMITDASIDGQTLSFIIPANKLNYAFLNSGFSDLNLLADITYGDVDVTVNLNPDSGEIDNMIMTFHATMEISGYEAEADYITEYSFIKRDLIQEDEVNVKDVSEGEWITEEEALELASDYWGVEAGEIDNETGFLISIMVMAYPSEEDPTYKIALREHVEGHVTTYDIILIDAVTGECTSFW